jgi:hypothetical protein
LVFGKDLKHLRITDRAALSVLFAFVLESDSAVKDSDHTPKKRTIS